jgi:acetyltransferase-like isoleucine patch superfamily enzyme
MIDTTLRNFIKAVRPNASTDIELSRLIGWYARKGFMPFIRGLFWSVRFSSSIPPLFVGSGVRIAYSKKMRVGKSVSIGSNVRIMALSEGGISLGDRTTVRENTWIQCSSGPSQIGVSLTIGTGTYIGPSAIIGVGGPISIGNDCQIGASFIVIAENHALGSDGPSAVHVERQGVKIGNKCWIGHRVTILDGVALGDGCTVGAGSVVTRCFPDGSVIGGVPARVLRPSIDGGSKE